MHPDLSPHLHTEECNGITVEFINCNKEVRNRQHEYNLSTTIIISDLMTHGFDLQHNFLRFLGKCDKVYDRMVHCFHLEVNMNK